VEEIKQYPHLTKAPIEEALIDIRVGNRSTISIEDLQKVYQEIQKDYPEKKDQKGFKGKIHIEKGSQTVKTEDLGIVGYQCSSADKKQIVQIRFDGFTFSRLRPYSNWEDLKPKVNNIWNIYKKMLSPDSVFRIAMRYINKFELPERLNLGDYFTNPIQLPKDLSGNIINSYLNRVLITIPEIDAKALVTQQLQLAKTAHHAEITFDIDLFKESEFVASEEEMWGFFEEIRYYRNKIFFESITKKTEELFK
jgi:uncharacterized protein (TIGR04255 family)